MTAPTILVLLVLTASCTSRPRAASPEPAPQPRVVSAPVADTATDPRLRASMRASLAIAARVDTILVTPETIELRTGEVLPPERLQVSARDAAGAIVEGFAPMIVLARNPVASYGAEGLRGLAPGAVDLLIESPVGMTPPNVTPRPRPSTRVRVIVRP